MKKGYWVVAYRSISDELAVRAYGALAVPAVEAVGGRFLTRSTCNAILCVSWLGWIKFSRSVQLTHQKTVIGRCYGSFEQAWIISGALVA